uniref:Cordon-bleu ubiquitin-like domain-containing protein n=1 Tax=Knipowitschia caucasica TaxID=637954 RepID=A0AAV2LFI1_KNICA
MLPGGLEKNATVHGSKPVMDLLVTLCASYHLNPSEYTVEVLSPGNNNISFTPNSPIGLLEAEKIVLKPRGGEEKIRTPYMPEATVRLLINYNQSRKTVVRVNPRLPLELLLPLVCDKCEFQLESTILLRDCESKEPLDPRRSLNEHGLREVYAKDTAAEDHVGPGLHSAADIAPTKSSSLSSSLQDLTKKEKKKSGSKGFLSLFRKHRKKSEPSHVVSAPSSPGAKLRSSSVSSQDVASCTTATADLRKKRRAPLPPMGASNSTPNNLGFCHLQSPQRSGDDTLRSTKRRAPPPPSATNHNKDATEDSIISLEEVKESEETVQQPSPSSSLPAPPSPPSLPPSLPPAPPSTHPLHKTHHPNAPSIHSQDLSDARAALAQVLTSSLTGGTLVKRLRNSSFSKAHNGASSVSESDVELKSVLCRNLQTDSDFGDAAGRRGLTTYKVVPSRRQSDAEPVPEEAEGAKVIPEPEQPVNPDLEEIETKPEQVNPEPEQVNPEPEQVTPEPEQVTPEPEQVTPEPEQARPGPEPEEAGPEPEEAGPEPEEAGPEPEEAGPEPEEAGPEPEEAGPEPEEAGPEPEEAGPELINVDPEPELAETESHLNKLEPDQAKPDHIHHEPDQVKPDWNQVALEPDQVNPKSDQAKPETDQVDPERDQVEPEIEICPQPELSSKTEECLDQSESGLPIQCLDEEETNSKDTVETAKQQNGEVECIVDHKVEASEPCHEINRDLYLGEEEVVQCHTETCDEKETHNTQEDDSFPPPPPPMYFNEDLGEADGGFVTNGHVCSNSEPPKLKPPAETLEAVVSAPSRFAHAVALAVQRTRLHSTGKTSAPVQQDT